MAIGPHRSTLAQHPDVRELLPRFVGRLPGYVQGLRQQLAAADGSGLQKSAHQLRGTGKTYGFGPITEHAARLEEALLAGRGCADVSELVETLVAYLENIEGYGQGES